MEIYFNPYPGAAKSAKSGIDAVVLAADVLFRLRKQCSGVPLSGRVSDLHGDLPPASFVLVRAGDMIFGIKNVIFTIQGHEREKVRLLLDMFSKGQIIDTETFHGVENWIVSAVGTAAPVLEIAAKKKAIALTIAAEEEWRINLIDFDDRENKLHNIWGQPDISALVKHCIDSLENSVERFAAQFNAKFCDGALYTAPNQQQWEHCGFFQNMERAKKRGYSVDDKLIKNVGQTSCGVLLELRCYGSGWRIFFVYRRGLTPEVIIGGFYQKGIGKNATPQNRAIQDAISRIDSYGA
jgi:hypothetical protein